MLLHSYSCHCHFRYQSVVHLLSCGHTNQQKMNLYQQKPMALNCQWTEMSTPDYAAVIDTLFDRFLTLELPPANPRPVPLFERLKWPVSSTPTQRVPHRLKERKPKPKLHCSLCEKNGEPPFIYTSHILKDPRGIVVCPILRKLACPICGYPGGDHSHTERYCPKNQNPAVPHRKALVRELKELPNSMGKRKVKRG